MSTDIEAGGRLLDIELPAAPAAVAEPWMVIAIIAVVLVVITLAWLAWRRYRVRQLLRLHEVKQQLAQQRLSPRQAAYAVAAILQDSRVHVPGNPRWQGFIDTLSTSRYARLATSHEQAEQLINEAGYWLRTCR